MEPLKELPLDKLSVNAVGLIVLVGIVLLFAYKLCIALCGDKKGKCKDD